MSAISWPDELGSLDLMSLSTRYASGDLTPSDVVTAVYDRIEARQDDHVWISLVDRATALKAAESLDPHDRTSSPLWGVPFAVKDNIDVAGLETTAGSPDFAYIPATAATCVQVLLDAGAIVIGKANLDQFATGLNGTRSPYGTPTNPYSPNYIPGGSSSGSAVAVSSGLVSFALGTDTAGSGRVPAALNNLVGMKPSIGLVSTAGVVPACRSVDCVSVFSLNVADGVTVLSALSGTDDADPHSRALPRPPSSATPAALPGLRVGVPDAIADWGSLGEQVAWAHVLANLQTHGVELVPMSLEDFFSAGAQLYGGAWLAERLSGIEGFMTEHPSSVLPVIRDVLAPGATMRAADAFESLTLVDQLRRSTRRALAGVDALLTPTVTATFTVEQMLADPVGLNSRLGLFTTFTNLLDLCAVAVPAGRLDHDMPFGVTLQAPSGQDARVAEIAAAVEPVLNTRKGHPDALPIAVVGAHLVGEPLHEDLLRHGAQLIERTTTAPTYRLFALDGSVPPKPGLRRVQHGGSEIEVEVYAFPTAAVGAFMSTVTQPLGIGQIDLADGRTLHGFICEPLGLDGARDITVFGGWRAYRASLSSTGSNLGSHS